MLRGLPGKSSKLHQSGCNGVQQLPVATEGVPGEVEDLVTHPLAAAVAGIAIGTIGAQRVRFLRTGKKFDHFRRFKNGAQVLLHQRSGPVFI